MREEAGNNQCAGGPCRPAPNGLEMDATLDRLIQAVRLRVGLEAAFDRSWSQCSPKLSQDPLCP